MGGDSARTLGREVMDDSGANSSHKVRNHRGIEQINPMQNGVRWNPGVVDDRAAMCAMNLPASHRIVGKEMDTGKPGSSRYKDT